MFGNAFVLIFLSDHESGDVLQENQGNHPLGTNLNEVSTLLGTLTEQNTIVGDDSNLLVVNPAESSQQSRSILLFVLLELRAIQNPC